MTIYCDPIKTIGGDQVTDNSANRVVGGHCFVLFPESIPSAEAFGTKRLLLILTPDGIVSAEAFGIALIRGANDPGNVALMDVLLNDVAVQDILLASLLMGDVLITGVSSIDTAVYDVRLQDVLLHSVSITDTLDL